MDTLLFDRQHPAGAFKPLNCVNGGPWHKRHAIDRWRTNLAEYAAARIPYTRNHDSNLSGGTFGILRH